MRVRCATPGDTRALGQRLGALAPAGTVVILDGELGAGKTVLAKGVGEGLGVPGRITSPTFILVALHEGGRLPLWHADLYRLGDAGELEALGVDDAADGVLLVEWGRGFADELPADHLLVCLDFDGEARQVELRATGPRHHALLEALRAG
jgi:tRNA threonylcarbamoyladenosine biosynthesis protein TsaE